MIKKIGSLMMVIALLLSMATAANAKCAGNDGKEHGRKKVVMVIAAKDFEDVEFFAPKAILEEHGVKVTVASTTTDTAIGYTGGTWKPDVLIQDVKVKKYDAVIVIGGYGIINEWDNPDLRELVIEANDRGKIVASICAAAPVLARAGVLKGKDATCFPWSGIYDELTKNGANYIDAETVVSGNAVTGRKPDASEAFGKALCQALGV